MLGSPISPLPRFASFARSQIEASVPSLRSPTSAGRRGLVGSCNPCLGFQGSEIFTVGHHKKWTDSRSTKTWVQSPVGPAISINEGTDSLSIAAASNNDFQFQDAYGTYDFTLSCIARIHSSATGKGHLWISDRIAGGNFQGEFVYVDESDKSIHVGLGDGSVGEARYYTPANALTLGVWHHIVVASSDYVTEDTGGNPGNPIVYVDGRVYDTTWNGVSRTLTHSASAPTNIGRHAGSSKLDLADWALWNVGLRMHEVRPLIDDPLCYLRKGRIQVALGSNLFRRIRWDDGLMSAA